MRPLAITLLCFALVAPAAAQKAPKGTARRLPSGKDVPTLVVYITVDQLREDYLVKYAPQFTNGLGRLVRGGAFFTNAMLDYENTETAPGHATGMSGRFPRSTGIVSNSRGVYDPQAPVIGNATMFASPFRFRGGTFIDWLRIKDARSQALSVSRKDRGAILPMGRAHQSVFWWDPASGRFTTSTYYADTLPTWLAAYNARRIPAQYAGTAWKLLLPDSAYAEPDSIVYENFGSDFLFPHPLPADTAAAIRALTDMPVMDELTLQVALRGVKAMNLGAGTWTDVVAISLSTTDAVGHRYGPDSREMHDQILRLDRALGAFLDSLYAVRDSTHIVIALTADHGVAPIPEYYTVTTHKAAQRVDLASLTKRYQQGLAARGADPDDFVFEEAMLWVHRAALQRVGIDVDSLEKAYIAEVRALPGVARVDRLADLAKDSARDPIARRWLHAIPADYPIEIVVTLKPYSVWGSYAAGIHGSPYDYDNRVPVVIYGAEVKAGHYDAPSLVVDLAPTLAWITGTIPTDRVDGSILWSALK